MLTENRLNIIARYNEDVLWSRHLLGKLIIYNKGETKCYAGDPLHKSDVEVRNVPNVGRETETYFRAIYENYDELPNYDSVALMQGEPFSHCKYLYEKLDHNLNGEYDSLASWHASHLVPSEDLIFNKNKHSIKKLLSEKNSEIVAKMTNGVDVSNEVKEMIYVLELLDIDYSNIKISPWACGAQYLVRTELLLNKSKSWWKSSWEMVYYLYDSLDCQHTGYAMERIWPLIWKHSNKIGGWSF